MFERDAGKSNQRKLDGQQLALGFDGGDWKYQAEQAFVPWLAERHREGTDEVTMEEFRAVAKLPDPHSLNCWGAFTRSMCLAGYIRDTGRRLKAESVSSHSREIKLWRIVSTHRREATA